MDWIFSLYRCSQFVRTSSSGSLYVWCICNVCMHLQRVRCYEWMGRTVMSATIHNGRNSRKHERTNNADKQPERKKNIIVVAYTATDEQMSPQHRKLATNRHSTQDELGAENINAISHKFPIPMDTKKRIKKKYYGHGTTHINSKKKGKTASNKTNNNMS